MNFAFKLFTRQCMYAASTMPGEASALYSAAVCCLATGAPEPLLKQWEGEKLSEGNSSSRMFWRPAGRSSREIKAFLGRRIAKLALTPPAGDQDSYTLTLTLAPAVTAAAAAGAPSQAAAAAAAGGGRSPGSRVWVVLEHAPCLVPFELRVQLLQHVLELEKASAVESGEVMHMWDDPMEPPQNRFVTIR